MIDLDRLHEQEAISHLDYYFATCMAQVFSHTDPLVLAGCALVSKALSEGHVCLDLKTVAGNRIPLPGINAVKDRLPDFDVWTAALKSSPMVGAASDDDSRKFPLVLDPDGCLYLSKYHDLQSRLVQALAARSRTRPRPVDPDFTGAFLDTRFKDQNPDHTRLQRQAVATAMRHNLTVISGGPGTGKTHVTRIIRDILTVCAQARGRPAPRFLCLAPTGRAASRLQDGATIHSVLIPRGDRPGFVHGKDNLLAADVVIIDEASMIDLALMTRLIEAIPPVARVILLGDDNQLSPVQAGAVFSDICQTGALRPFVVSLTYNFRSQGRAGIENLANAIRNNDVDTATGILTASRYPDIVFEPPETGYARLLETYIREGYGPFMAQEGLTRSLDLLDRFRILCAHNKGEYGTLQINHLCEKFLRGLPGSGIRRGLLKQMIMINTNDYTRGLFNGDTGVVVSQNDTMLAGFRTDNGMIRKFGYMDLPSHEPAFGVTIHKSQGSEFETVLIVIPEKLSRVMTRQLLYTGVTRARKKAVILGPLPVIKEAMALSMKKMSNLSCLLDRELSSGGADHSLEA